MQTIGDAMRAEGMAHTLTLVLETRFGDLPEEVLDRISTADVPQLDRWTLNVLDAPTLEAAIGGDDGT